MLGGDVSERQGPSDTVSFEVLELPETGQTRPRDGHFRFGQAPDPLEERSCGTAASRRTPERARGDSGPTRILHQVTLK